MYWIVTFLESLLAVFGIRAPLEESSYAVSRRFDRGVEIRVYAPRTAIETDSRGQGDADAFRRLFDTISGGNRRGERIAMTAPVAVSDAGIAETVAETLAMTVPVEQSGRNGGGTMRFFLPAATAAHPPEPIDPHVRLVRVPEQRLAVLRFSGRATQQARRERGADLARVLAQAGVKPAGEPLFMGYDPPFTIPFLRRNEVAVPLAPD